MYPYSFVQKKKDVSQVVYQTLQTTKIYFRKLLG